MKQAVVRSDAFHFNLQVVHAASVQKRGLLQNLINATISQIQQQVQAGVITIQGVSSQIASVTGNVTAGLQTVATAVTTQVTRYPTCANEQTGEVADIMSQAGMLLYQLY